MNAKDAGKVILDELINGNELVSEDDEQGQVASAKAILSALQTLQASIMDPSPAQQHDITAIRASANSIIRLQQTV